jgi:hypothetical protein
MRLLLLSALVAGTAACAYAEQLPRPGTDESGVYAGVDIPHHDHAVPDKPRETVGRGRPERIERCQTIMLRREDGGVQKLRRCRD